MLDTTGGPALLIMEGAGCPGCPDLAPGHMQETGGQPRKSKPTTNWEGAYLIPAHGGEYP